MRLNKKNLVQLALSALLLLSCLLLSCCHSIPDGEGSDTAVQSPSDSQSAPTRETVTYTVTVRDQNGNAVPGVSVQVCDDTSCYLPATTDENGVMTFTYPESKYHITIVECPAGFTADPDQAFFFPDGSTELVAEITKN